MSRFEPNQKGMDQAAGAAAKAVEEAVNEVARTHAGRPKSEVRTALRKAVSKRGVRYEPADDIVAEIASASPVTE